MNRVMMTTAALTGAAMPMMFDSALKGLALLLFATLSVLVLWRASASARHLVWLVALAALLIVPLLSVALPQWRVLPQWAVVPVPSVLNPADIVKDAKATPVAAPQAAPSNEVPRPAVAHPSALPEPASAPPAASSVIPLAANSPSEPARHHWIPLVWATGCGALLLRLLAAHWLLRRTTRESEHVSTGPLTDALVEASFQLGLRKPVRLLLDAGRTIPVVWGVFRPRLLLPAEAREWDESQLRSVLLHELAHVRRHDTTVQWLTQLACALHWFNPLVWIAAWRVHTERERACDDLVLASGVRASEYAGHLLHVASQLSPARWTGACGLAMARKSRLEGRLLAVLSDKMNRRRVTAAIAATALLLGAGVAIPLAMLRAGETFKVSAPDDIAVPHADRAGMWSLAGGVTLEVTQDVFHGADVTSSAILRWPAASDRPALRHEFGLASDAFGNHEPWLMAWEKDATALWIVTGPMYMWKDRPKGKNKVERVRRLDFSDPAKITEDHWIPAAPFPDKIRAAFAVKFDLPEPGAPTEEQHYTAVARLEHARVIRARTTDTEGKPMGGVAVQLAFDTHKDRPFDHTRSDGDGWFWSTFRPPLPALTDGCLIHVTAQRSNGIQPPPGFREFSIETPAAVIARSPSGTNAARGVFTGVVRIEKGQPLEGALVAVGDASGGVSGLTTHTDREGKFHLPLNDLPENQPAIVFVELGKWGRHGHVEGVHFASGRTAATLVLSEGKGSEWKVTAEFNAEITTPPPGSIDPGALVPNLRDDPQAADGAAWPQHEYAQALFRIWQKHARTGGNIPGALIGELASEVHGFFTRSADETLNTKFRAVHARMDAARDWPQAEAVALLNELTAIATGPVSWSETKLVFAGMRNIENGQPLPVELESAAWGKPADNGLRAAWLLVPRGEQYAPGSVLKARVLFNNTGKDAVTFSTETFHQYDGCTALNASGKEIKLSGAKYSGITPRVIYRLAPGEYAEVQGTGVAIGAGEYKDGMSVGSVGTIIEANPGDEVRVTWSVDANPGFGKAAEEPEDEAARIPYHIQKRLLREGPLPASKDDRQLLIRRVFLDLTGLPPAPEDVAAFVGDDSPDALTNLTGRLLGRPAVAIWKGALPTGEVRFRVIPADPGAAVKPHAANSPGRHVLGDTAHLFVRQTTVNGEETNTAQIVFFGPDPKEASPHKPHDIKLSGGTGTYAFAWVRGSGVLWVGEKGVLRSYDFNNPTQVQETRYVPWGVAAPVPIRELLEKQLAAPQPASPSEPKKTSQQPPGPMPKRTHLFDDKQSAVALQTDNDVKFVLYHRGFLQTGMAGSLRSDGTWEFTGKVTIKDKREFELRYTSAEPDTLYLDGKAWGLNRPISVTAKGAIGIAGRIFILQEKGDPIQTDRTLPLRTKQDLVTLGDFAQRDLFAMETYAESRRVQAMDGWVLAWDVQNPMQHGDGQRSARLRIFPDGRVLSLPDGRNLKELKMSAAEIAELLRWLAEDREVPGWKPLKVKVDGGELEMDPVTNEWDAQTDFLKFRRDGKMHGIVVSAGPQNPGGEIFDEIRNRLRKTLQDAGDGQR